MADHSLQLSQASERIENEGQSTERDGATETALENVEPIVPVLEEELQRLKKAQSQPDVIETEQLENTGYTRFSELAAPEEKSGDWYNRSLALEDDALMRESFNARASFLEHKAFMPWPAGGDDVSSPPSNDPPPQNDPWLSYDFWAFGTGGDDLFMAQSVYDDYIDNGVVFIGYHHVFFQDGVGGVYFDAGDGYDDIYGSEGDDLIYGGGGNDTIEGRGGDDIIYGGDGHDSIVSGDGNDILYGDDGEDYIEGGNGDDILHGGDDEDYMTGGDGDDVLHGGQGHDTLLGEDGNDTLYGDEGHDKLYGDGGDDVLYGGDGNDTLYGGAGRNTLIGGAGYDNFAIVSYAIGEDVFADFELGVDTIMIGSNVMYAALQSISGSDHLPLQSMLDGFVMVANDGDDALLYIDDDGCQADRHGRSHATGPDRYAQHLHDRNRQ